MGFIDWIKQTAGNIGNGVKWLGDKVFFGAKLHSELTF